MPSLRNAQHERFARLRSQGLTLEDCYRKVYGDVKTPAVSASVLAKRQEVKERITELQSIVDSQYAMLVGEKRDVLRRMILGEVPTKIIRKSNGKVEAVFDRHAALVTDAKLAGEFAPEKLQVESGPILKLEWRTAMRNTGMSAELTQEYNRLKMAEGKDVTGTPEEPEVVEFDSNEALDRLEADYAARTIEPRRYPPLEELQQSDVLVSPDFDAIPTE